MESISSGASVPSNVPDQSWNNLMGQDGNVEIKGKVSLDSDGSPSAEVEVGGDKKSSNILWQAYRSVTRSSSQKESYRQGIENVRALLREKYDNNAVERFDNHFAYRRWAGKPLTVGAFNVFIAKEEELRQGSVNISTLGQNAKKLENLQGSLSADKQNQKDRIIGGSKTAVAAKTDYAFPFLPIARSYFSFSANAKDVRKGHEQGIAEAREAILNLIVGNNNNQNQTTRIHVEHLFNCHFAAKIEKKETLTVRELSTFVDDAIKMRDDENGIFSGLYRAVTTAKDRGEDTLAAASKFLKETYHAMGIAAGAAVVLDQERSTNDPIMGLVKAIGAGSIVAAENTSERILTAIGLYFLGTPAAASETSITSSVLKFFSFGIY